MINEPLVTIVVAMRERFSMIGRSLASIAANTTAPHRLVCVVGGAPTYVEDLLRQRCEQHGYDLILRDEPLSPNASRNLGLAHAHTRYVAFLDNDAIVAPGWLEALVQCAEETGGDVVGPLCLIGDPAEGLVHSAGGNLEFVQLGHERDLVERHLVSNVCLNTKSVHFERTPCDFAEFHCMLVRRSVFDLVGPLDEEVFAVAEHTDFALEVKKVGGRIWFEPAAMVSYLWFDDLTVGDLTYFDIRWSDDWTDRSVKRLAEKWPLAEDGRFFTDLAAFTRRHRPRGQLPRHPSREVAPIEPDAHGFAQTNVQLLNQMRTSDYPAHDREAVRAGYDAACQLFAAKFHPSGKPFLAHLVGTASVLAAYGAHAPLVNAGLLHASYSRGRFPADIADDYDAKRRWLGRQVGRLPEAIIHEYTQLDYAWIAGIVEKDVDRLTLDVAYAVVLRVANLIEERLDHATTCYATDEFSELHAAEQSQWAPIYDAVMGRLGYRDMLSAATDLAARVDPKVAPPEQRRSGTFAFIVDPESGTPQPMAPLRATRQHGGTGEAAVAAFVLPRGPVVGELLAELGPSLATAQHGGHVTPEGVTLRVCCDPRQWAYSASYDIGSLQLTGPAIVRVTVTVESGELGVALLLRGNSNLFAAPEQNQGPTDEPVELLFPLARFEDATAIVLRSWAPAGVITCAYLTGVTVHAPAGEWSSRPTMITGTGS